MVMITLLKKQKPKLLQESWKRACGYGLRSLERPRRGRQKIGVQEPTALCSSKRARAAAVARLEL